jgi:predicted GTPase
MLFPDGSPVMAAISDSAKGCTFHTSSYHATIDGLPFNIFDTAGMNEGETGSLMNKDAIGNLHRLVRGLAAVESSGIHLLVFVVKLGRITDSTIKNYKLFYQTICSESVPIVLVATHAENASETWWGDNEAEYRRQGMSFKGQASITAIRGKLKRNRYTLQEEYDESKEPLMNLILQNHLPNTKGWKKPMVRILICSIYNTYIFNSHCNDLAYVEMVRLYISWFGKTFGTSPQALLGYNDLYLLEGTGTGGRQGGC